MIFQTFTALICIVGGYHAYRETSSPAARLAMLLLIVLLIFWVW